MIEHVTDTAFLIAQYRADESRRRDALFNDPFAERLAGTKGREVAAAHLTGRMTSYIVAIRTVIIDGLIERFVADGGDVVLNLGAGLDARPYRMRLPRELRWIEVDFPSVIEYKRNILRDDEPVCRLERVPLDLSDEAQRRAFLQQVGEGAQRVLVLTEGVIPYLTNDQVASLARDLHEVAHVHGWIVDYVDPEFNKYRMRGRVRKQMGDSPFQFDPADWFGFFESVGWKPQEMRYIAMEGERVGRRFKAPLLARIMMLVFRPFMSRAQKEKESKVAGYALLVPAEL